MSMLGQTVVKLANKGTISYSIKLEIMANCGHRFISFKIDVEINTVLLLSYFINKVLMKVSRNIYMFLLWGYKCVQSDNICRREFKLILNKMFPFI